MVPVVVLVGLTTVVELSNSFIYYVSDHKIQPSKVKAYF